MVYVSALQFFDNVPRKVCCSNTDVFISIFITCKVGSIDRMTAYGPRDLSSNSAQGQKNELSEPETSVERSMSELSGLV